MPKLDFDHDKLDVPVSLSPYEILDILTEGLTPAQLTEFVIELMCYWGSEEISKVQDWLDQDS